MNKPNINVTPLIDVLLVLLIIFMVVTPMKPSSFRASIPAVPPDNPDIRQNIDTLVVIIEKDRSLRLNNESGMGTTNEPSRLIDRLGEVFKQRVDNGNISQSFADSVDRPFADRAERTVFIKSARVLDYGSVARIVDAVKLAGAYPISLQIDELE